MKKVILLIALIFLLSSCSVGTSEVITRESNYFPQVGGMNLHGDELEFPSCLHTERTILVVAYQRWQQSWVDAWYTVIEPEVAESKGQLSYYEVPTISKLSAPIRYWIYNGMRGGIKSDKMRSQVITLHIDKEPFNKALEVVDEEIVYVFVVDKQGRILYRDKGQFNEEKGKSLLSFLHKGKQ